MWYTAVSVCKSIAIVKSKWYLNTEQSSAYSTGMKIWIQGTILKQIVFMKSNLYSKSITVDLLRVSQTLMNNKLVQSLTRWEGRR